MISADDLAKIAAQLTAARVVDKARTMKVPKAMGRTGAQGSGNTIGSIRSPVPPPPQFGRFGHSLVDQSAISPASKTASAQDLTVDALPGAALGALGGGIYGATQDGNSPVSDTLFYGLVGAAGGGLASAGAGHVSRRMANTRLHDVTQRIDRSAGAARQLLGPDAEAHIERLGINAAKPVVQAAAAPGIWGARVHRAVGDARKHLESFYDAVDTQAFPAATTPEVKQASDQVVLYKGMRTPPQTHDTNAYQQALDAAMQGGGYTAYERLRAASRTARHTLTPSLAHAQQYAGPGGWIMEVRVPRGDLHAFHGVPLRSDRAGRTLAFEIDDAALQDRIRQGLWHSDVRRHEEEPPPIVDMGPKVASEYVRRRVEVILVRDGGQVLLCSPEGKPDVVTLPGGGVRPGESLRDAAAREIREEVGTRHSALLRLNHEPVVIPTPGRGPGQPVFHEETYFFLADVTGEGDGGTGPGKVSRKWWASRPIESLRPTRAADPWGAAKALRAAYCEQAMRLHAHYLGGDALTKTSAVRQDTAGFAVYTGDGCHVLGKYASLQAATAHARYRDAVMAARTKTAFIGAGDVAGWGIKGLGVLGRGAAKVLPKSVGGRLGGLGARVGARAQGGAHAFDSLMTAQALAAPGVGRNADRVASNL